MRVTKEEIAKDYKEVKEMILKCKTFEDLYELAKHTQYTIEVNGDDIPLMDKPEHIEWVRVETYGCLDYIYFNDWESGNPEIWFDVWDEDSYDDVIVDAHWKTIEYLYDEWIRKVGE